jgi:hypothetical protein
MKLAPIDRFWLKVNKNGLVPLCRPELGACWLWTGGTNSSSTTSTKEYGRFWSDGRVIAAHRWSYEYFVGPIPDGLEIDHLCRTTLCVRATHLEPVTRRVNLLRGDTFAARNVKCIQCPHGHLYDVLNTGICRKGRYCRACHNECDQRSRDRKKVKRLALEHLTTHC